MKEKFTKLMAALVLLVFMAPSVVGWGQTNVTWPGTTALPGTATAIANDQNVTIMVSSTNTYSNPIRIYANTTVTINALNDAKILSVSYEASSTGDYVTNAQAAVVTPNVTPTVSGKIVTWTYTESGNVTAFTFTPSAQTRSNGISVTYKISGGDTPQPTTYTVTLADNNTTLAQATSGASITLPTRNAIGSYTFAGWSSTNVPDETTTAPTIIPAGPYTPTADITLYPVYTRSEGGGTTTEWRLTSLDAADAGVYALLTTDGHAFNGTISSGHGQATSGVFSFTDGVAATAPTGVCEITFESVSGGFKMYNASNGYLYASAASSGKLAWHNSENSYWFYGSSNWKYNANNAFLRSYGNNSFRTYGQNNGDVLRLAKKIEVSGTTTYYWSTPSSTPIPSITANDVNIAYDATSGIIEYAIAYGVEGGAVSATTTAEWLTIGTVGETVPFTCSANNTTSDRTATVRLTYTYGRSAVTKDITVTQAASTADYATLPFAFDGGRSDVATTVGLTQENLGTDYSASPKLKFEKGNKDNDGLYSTLILHFNERPGNLSFDIKGNSFSGGTFKVQVSADGVTYTDFVTYTDLPGTNEGSQHVSINHLAEDVRYIKWVYAEKVNGNVALGNIALDVYEAPEAYTLFIADADDVTILTQGITNGGSATVYSGTLVTLEVRITPGYVLDEVIVLDENGQPVTLTQVSEGYWSFYMPDSDVMVSADMVVAHAPVYYNLATTIQSGKRYIIVGKNNGVYYAMGVQRTNSHDVQTNRAAKPITVEGTTASVTRSDVYDFTISLESDGTYSIYDEEAQGYLYVPNSTNNYIGTYTGLDENGKWTITFDPETGAATVVANNKTMQYNTSNKLFSCYASGSQDPVYLYKINDEFTFDVIGYTSTKDHYYLIASPVTVDPATVEGMTTDDYDLYYFDPSQEKEWINYKGDAALDNPGGFWLEPGKGYLYAKKATADHPTYSFGLSGELYEGDGTFDLVPGWNLVGNPYKEVAELSCSDDFYVINETELGSELIAGDDWNIQPLTGLFVYSDEPDALVTFSPIRSGAKPAGLSLNLANGRSVVDRAIVRFGEGKQLPKFQLNESSTKLYIPQGNQDFAVVRSAGEGEMPVSFKAEKDGTYTLSMSADEVTFDYLHLIDNMTGMDVDLLQTPSYTFEARTSDYTSRFRLIFSANDGDSLVDETFAFFNGSGWTVSNLGEATLQVVDVMGRVVSSQSINGNATINVNEAAGIYMFRLINGENVKVQKVVVR